VNKPHKKLVAWQRGMDLCMKVYEVTEAFPKQELYGLISQMRRATVSIPCNISEGAARRSSKESAQFYNIARGSLSELDTQVEIARRLGYMNENTSSELEGIMLDVDLSLHGLWKKALL
jgi:four helix bundle protein